MTGSLPATRQEIGTSIASVETFLPARSLVSPFSGTERIGVDQVERFADVDDEAFTALTDEHAAAGAAAGDVDVVDVVVGVRVVDGRVVVENRFVADPVDWLLECRAAAGGRDAVVLTGAARARGRATV